MSYEQIAHYEFNNKEAYVSLLYQEHSFIRINHYGIHRSTKLSYAEGLLCLLEKKTWKLSAKGSELHKKAIELKRIYDCLQLYETKKNNNLYLILKKEKTCKCDLKEAIVNAFNSEDYVLMNTDYTEVLTIRAGVPVIPQHVLTTIFQ